MADAEHRRECAQRLDANAKSDSKRWIRELHESLDERANRSVERLAPAHMHFIEGYCQSPIERLLATWLLSIDVMYLDAPRCIDGRIRMNDAIDDAPIDQVSVFAQVNVGQYVADFFIVMKYEGARDGLIQLVAVECDGHEFHSRTKEQAEHDRKRDRVFQSLGVSVFRFTGSEIFRSPRGCVEEVSAFLSEKIERAWGIGS
jgi:very-short-patch-repair endonuclease